MFDLTVLGELLVDFTMIGTSEQQNPIFERNPGGGPANMACAAARLGVKAALLSKVGDDMFGHALKDIIAREGVDNSQIIFDSKRKTTLAFVQLTESGERSFSFYRKNAADTAMNTEEFCLDVVEKSKYFFFSSVLMAEGSSREVSFELAAHAKQHGVTVFFDPNLRLMLWESEEELKKCVMRAFEFCDIVKLSDEELLLLNKEREEDVRTAAHRMMEQYPIKVLLITLGGDGCLLLTRENVAYVEGFTVEQPVDTTAAGDSFNGGFISRLVELGKPFSEMSFSDLCDAVHVGNAVGSLTVQKKGAISALPQKSEVERVLLQKG